MQALHARSFNIVWLMTFNQLPRRVFSAAVCGWDFPAADGRVLSAAVCSNLHKNGSFWLLNAASGLPT